ncbi:MAG: hypothetical protein ABI156_13065, partial [Caldimonas sp.]
RWFVEMFYPLLQSRRNHSSLVRGGQRYAMEDGDADFDAAALRTPASPAMAREPGPVRPSGSAKKAA